MTIKSLTKTQLIDILKIVDSELSQRHQKIDVTILGGASIILMGIRDRATMDIDIATHPDARLFESLCRHHGLHVDVVTITSTVDLHHCPTITVFSGAHLTLKSVTATDLVKLKLERFRKQDPDDIYAIIQHEQLIYDAFRDLVMDMFPDFIGNPRVLALSAQIVVEQVFPEHADSFAVLLKDRKIL